MTLSPDSDSLSLILWLEIIASIKVIKGLCSLQDSLSQDQHMTQKEMGHGVGLYFTDVSSDHGKNLPPPKKMLSDLFVC